MYGVSQTLQPTVMKSTIYIYCIYMSLLLALGIGMPCATAQESEESRADYTESTVKRSKDGKQLEIDLRIRPGRNLKSQELVRIYPCYVSATGSDTIRMEPLYLAGRTRFKVIKREIALHNRPGSMERVVDVMNLDATPIHEHKSVDFERWMADGRLIVMEEISGCAECEVGKAVLDLMKVKIPLFGEGYYEYPMEEPLKVTVKAYVDSLESRVTFPVGKHVLDASFGENAKALKELDSFLSRIVRVTGVTLKGVTIQGYASPEGRFDKNKSLAERRTHSLADYVNKQYPELKANSDYAVYGVGEDWKGLRSRVALSALPEREQVVSIIDRYDTDTEREREIRKLNGGEVYKTLLRDFYPPLRRTVFTLRAEVAPYTEAQLPEIYDRNPKLLSHHELYTLAQRTEEQGRSPLEIYRSAYEIYPSDPIAALNYANALLKYASDADGALRILVPLKGDVRSLYPMAVAYDMKGDHRKAESLLKEAAEKGSEVAVRIVEQMRR